MRVPRFRKYMLPLCSNLPGRWRHYVPSEMLFNAIKTSKTASISAHFGEEITRNFKPTDCKAVTFRLARYVSRYCYIREVKELQFRVILSRDFSGY
jgi:hypothetical protein